MGGREVIEATDRLEFPDQRLGVIPGARFGQAMHTTAIPAESGAAGKTLGRAGLRRGLRIHIRIPATFD